MRRPFLEDGQEACRRTHAIRPQKCRIQADWDEFLDNPGALREAARLCPGTELSSRPLYPGFDSADDYGVFRLAAILLSSLWISGCFVADEIRHGDALIEQHSVGWREKKKGMQQAEEESVKSEAETQSRKARNAGPGVKDKLSDWWHETVDEEPTKANRDDKLVSCKIGGKVKFIRKSDCQIRRGRAAELKTQRKTTVTAPSEPKPRSTSF